MDLNHRVVNPKEVALKVAIHRVRYPMAFIIPGIILFLSLTTVINYFGQSWDVGTFSTNVIPGLSNLLANIFSTDSNLIISAIVIILYSLESVFSYIFIYFVTKRHLPAILIGLLTILPTFPYSSLPPGRLMLALQNQDGAHIAGLSFIPLAATFFLLYLRTGDKKHLLFLTGLISLLTILSFFSLQIFLTLIIIIFVSEILISHGRLKIKRLLTTLIFFICIFIVIYNISLWRYLISDEGNTVWQVLYNLLPLLFFIIPVFGTFAFLIFDRRPYLQPLFISLSLTIIFGLFHFVRVSFVDIPIFNQDRYEAEVAFSVYFLISIMLTWIFDLIRAGKILQKKPYIYNNRTKVAFIFMGIIVLSLVFSIIFIPRGI